jgi:hypothetical protein
MPQLLADLMTNPNLARADAAWLASAIASDCLRRCNVDELPRLLAAIGAWRADVLAAIRANFPQHCEGAGNG